MSDRKSREVFGMFLKPDCCNPKLLSHLLFHNYFLYSSHGRLRKMDNLFSDNQNLASKAHYCMHLLSCQSHSRFQPSLAPLRGASFEVQRIYDRLFLFFFLQRYPTESSAFNLTETYKQFLGLDVWQVKKKLKARQRKK